MRLVRASRAAERSWSPDPGQESVLADRSGLLRVLGGPGTGKSSLAARIVVSRVTSGELTADQCLVLSPTRRAAARLRDLVAEGLTDTHSAPLARTPHSYGFGLLRRRAALRDEAMPRLISGPEQDVILRDLLEGYAVGAAPGPNWPPSLGEAVGTRTFRSELRDLIMRAVELGLGVEGLEGLGRRHGRPEWVAAAAVLKDYDEVTALASAGALDPAWLLGAAVTALGDDEVLAASVCEDLRLVVVDDAQDLTPGAAELVRRLATLPGVDLVLLGDPDSATQTFRGAEPALMVDHWPSARELALETSHRSGTAVKDVADRVVGHIGAVAGTDQRRWLPADVGGSARALVFRTPAQEAAWVADLLRRRHLLEGVPWSSMAVVVRSSTSAATLGRVLRSARIPVESEVQVPIRDHPAVRPFLMVARSVIEGSVGAGVSFDGEQAVDLLTSWLGGADPVALRRLRRALRREELDAGRGRPSSELLADALVSPELGMRLGPEAQSLRRVAKVVAAAVATVSSSADDGIETLLWNMWEASGLAEGWQRAALHGGPAGRRADDALDAVLALFESASRFAERLPGAAPAAFLDHLLAQDLAADTLAARSPAGEAVALVTPADAAGREWDIVCVVGVQEGSWPDPRLRGILLGAPDLVDAARGRPLDRLAARTAVIHDETRLFHVAVTRTRHEVVVSAVRSEDQQPSPYLDLVEPRPDGAPARRPTDVPRQLSLTGLVGELRRELVGEDPRRRAAAATALATLVEAGVPGADPSSWWPLRSLTADGPRRAPDQVVRISPSQLDGFERCQLQWLLRGCGGQGPSIGSSQVGTLVHEIANDLGDTTASAYAAELRERWGSLGLPANWLSRRTFAEATAMTGRLAGHVASSGAAGWTCDGREVKVDVVTGRARIVGSVDRVERDALGRVRIVDLKTGASKPSSAEVARHRQLGAYQVAVEAGALGGDVRSGGAALLQLGKAAATAGSLQLQVPLEDDVEPGWAHEAIATDADAMAGATFLARPSRSVCATCQVRSSCPALPEGRPLA